MSSIFITASKDLKVKRITPRHLQMVIREDEGFDTIMNPLPEITNS